MCALAFAILAASASASVMSGQDSLANAANPIRRVVTLLQNMAKKIAAESKKEEELYDKYMCYCKTAGGTLQGSIDAAENKVPQVESALKEAEEQKTQLEQDVKDHQAARADAKASMAKATAIREKEAAEFAKEKAEYDTNIDQLGGAISAIEKGMTGFLQTKTAEMVRRLALNSDLSNFDRQLVMSFLSGSQAANVGYVPKSTEITGILKQMKDTMVKDLADITATEKTSISDYESLMEAKTKEVHSCTKSIETKSARVGELGVSIAEMHNDLDDTSAALLEDKKFLANMDKTCDAKKKEWEEITKARAEETLAIQETIKILNDDDALELFKKTLPNPSFVQTVVNFDRVKRKALALVQELQERPIQQRAHLDMISLALSGRKVSFEKVIKMIDDMVGILGQEQIDDDQKKEYCEKQLDTNDDKKKSLQQDLKDLETTIADSKETIATLADEIKQLTKGIEALDKDVAESTATRKEEHEDYSELMSSDAAAKELLGLAKNRLNKYYNPKLYKPPPKRELTEEQRIYTNMGGELAPTAAPGGIAGTGVTAFVQIHEHRSISDVAPPPPPEAFKAYSSKGDESTGVIAMVDLLIADLDKEMTEAETAEKDAQKEYEAFMADAAEKRATDSKAITDKEGYKADAESALEAAKEGQTSKVKELMATEKYIASLHSECDWLISNFDIRKQARADEVEALKNAKAVLAGADFSFVQKEDVTRALRGSH
jgi:chromosome segregation ATPase